MLVKVKDLQQNLETADTKLTTLFNQGILDGYTAELLN